MEQAAASGWRARGRASPIATRCRPRPRASPARGEQRRKQEIDRRARSDQAEGGAQDRGRPARRRAGAGRGATGRRHPEQGHRRRGHRRRHRSPARSTRDGLANIRPAGASRSERGAGRRSAPHRPSPGPGPPTPRPTPPRRDQASQAEAEQQALRAAPSPSQSGKATRPMPSDIAVEQLARRRRPVGRRPGPTSPEGPARPCARGFAGRDRRSCRRGCGSGSRCR